MPPFSAFEFLFRKCAIRVHTANIVAFICTLCIAADIQQRHSMRVAAGPRNGSMAVVLPYRRRTMRVDSEETVDRTVLHRASVHTSALAHVDHCIEVRASEWHHGQMAVVHTPPGPWSWRPNRACKLLKLTEYFCHELYLPVPIFIVIILYYCQTWFPSSFSRIEFGTLDWVLNSRVYLIDMQPSYVPAAHIIYKNTYIASSSRCQPWGISNNTMYADMKRLNNTKYTR